MVSHRTKQVLQAVATLDISTKELDLATRSVLKFDGTLSGALEYHKMKKILTDFLYKLLSYSTALPRRRDQETQLSDVIEALREKLNFLLRLSIRQPFIYYNSPRTTTLSIMNKFSSSRSYH